MNQLQQRYGCIMADTFDFPAAVAAAIRAPSLHNSQPKVSRLKVSRLKRS